MEYRTLIVVDGADNLIECHLNLVDYSSRRGESSATEKFVDLQLEEHENRRLQLVIQDILRSRRVNPFGDMISSRTGNRGIVAKAIPDEPQEPLQLWKGDMLASRYAQKGIISSVIHEKPLTPELQLVATGAVWDDNMLNFEFARRPLSEGNLIAGEIPILSCPFLTSLRKLDGMTKEEKQKVLEVLDMQSRLPFHSPHDYAEFSSLGRRLPSKEPVISNSENMKVPDSPLTHGWSSSGKKHERSKLTVSVNGEDEPELSPKSYEGCVYGNGNLTCPRPKKRSQIYCGHHLRLVSHKHQKSRALKRSRSSVDLGDDQDVDYAGLE